MELNKNALLIAAAAMIAVPATAAPITIDLTTSGATGAALDNGTALTALPLTVDVAEDLDSLELTVVSASSFDSANSTVNGSSSSFAINSPTPSGGSENSVHFDVDAAELMQIAFNADVKIISIGLVSFTGTEQFSFGGVEFGDGDAPSNIFTFAGDGLAVSANTGINISAVGPAGTSVGLESITLEVVPEPSTMTLLLAGGLMIARRRRCRD